MSFTSIIRFQVKPGMEAEFESAFGASGMLSRPKAILGFRQAQLLRRTGDASEYLVIGHWESEQAYAAWQSVSALAADRQAVAALLNTLIDPQPGKLFRSVASSE